MTSMTPDLLRRGIPIRLFYEGDTKKREFEGEPLKYAQENRLAILGELAGMVETWVDAGRPLGRHNHRCAPWAREIGGILAVAGLGEFFLANSAEAEIEMNAGLTDLASLAEHVVTNRLADLWVALGADASSKGKPPSDLVRVFEGVGILRDKLAEARGPKGQATIVGNFLGVNLNRSVPIETAEGPRTVTLRRREERSHSKLYYFEIAADVAPTVPDMTSATTPSAGEAESVKDDDLDALPTVRGAGDGSPEPIWL
jgi:hypothetical protein